MTPANSRVACTALYCITVLALCCPLEWMVYRWVEGGLNSQACTDSEQMVRVVPKETKGR